MARPGQGSLLVAALALACDGETEVGRFLAGSAACETRGIDPFQLTALGADGRSHWLQPWRAYRDTWPAARMRQAAGLSIGVSDSMVTPERRARLMAAAGVRRALIGLGWNSMSFDDPTRIDEDDRQRLRRAVLAAAQSGLRPLVAFDANHVAPVPARGFDVALTAAAAKGAREIRVDAASAARIVPGRSGLSRLPSGVQAEVLFTAVEAGGRVSLSKPLPVDLAAGVQRAALLRFQPFGRPLRADGRPNPRFEETLRGWLDYVRAFATETREVLGHDGFDVEIWNELKQGSSFLDINLYYDPPIDDGPGDAVDLVTRAIVERTVALLRDPQTGVPRVGIGDGFGNTRWQTAGSTAVPGLTAINRHVSVHGLRFPDEAATLGGTPLDARGRPDGGWSPSYVASFPELPLTAVVPLAWTRPGQLARDLAPIVTVDAAGSAHGRTVHPPGGAPLEIWLTALSWSPSWSREQGAPIRTGDLPHLQAKAALRSLTAYVGAGASALFFYAPTESESLRIIDWNEATGGLGAAALGRFFAAFGGPATIDLPRALNLVAISSCQSGRQFAGDGSPARPPLWNRDVVAAFPFQIDRRTFVVAAYVMTRDMAAVRQPALGDARRFDLPEEAFRLAFEGAGAPGAEVEAHDPLTGAPVRASIVPGGDAARLVVEMPLTDSPRLLRITTPAGP